MSILKNVEDFLSVLMLENENRLEPELSLVDIEVRGDGGGNLLFLLFLFLGDVGLFLKLLATSGSELMSRLDGAVLVRLCLPAPFFT